MHTPSLTLTRHARERCQQRGIRPADLDLVLDLGAETDVGVFLGRREADVMIARLKRLIRHIERTKNTCIAAEHGAVITVYKADRRRGHAGGGPAGSPRRPAPSR